MDGKQQNLSVEKIEKALDLLQQAARDKMNELKTLILDKYPELKDVLFDGHNGFAHNRSDAAGQMQDNASAGNGRGRDTVHQAEPTFDQFIREQPLKSILIAAGVGWVLGRFWKR
jgi:ElaB/YqjD/DUF883 family membrane-anchored ribosome-binding protein